MSEAAPENAETETEATGSSFMADEKTDSIAVMVVMAMAVLMAVSFVGSDQIVGALARVIG